MIFTEQVPRPHVPWPGGHRASSARSAILGRGGARCQRWLGVARRRCDRRCAGRCRPRVRRRATAPSSSRPSQSRRRAHRGFSTWTARSTPTWTTATSRWPARITTRLDTRSRRSSRSTNPAGPWGPNSTGEHRRVARGGPPRVGGEPVGTGPVAHSGQHDDCRRGQASPSAGAWLDIRGTTTTPRRNVIVRNITFEDVYDCFPAWTPRRNADGTWAGTGDWDAEYDAISLRESEGVWVDHNEFRDVATADSTLPTYFGSKYQVHDGHLDITNASDLVTASYNRFRDHDKTMLVSGLLDTAPRDVGRLRVTLHHNLFENLGQRAPASGTGRCTSTTTITSFGPVIPTPTAGASACSRCQ